MSTNPTFSPIRSEDYLAAEGRKVTITDGNDGSVRKGTIVVSRKPDTLGNPMNRFFIQHRKGGHLYQLWPSEYDVMEVRS